MKKNKNDKSKGKLKEGEPPKEIIIAESTRQAFIVLQNQIDAAATEMRVLSKVAVAMVLQSKGVVERNLNYSSDAAFQKFTLNEPLKEG